MNDKSPCGAPASKHRAAKSSDGSDTELAALAKAIAHPVRIQILRMLADRKTCVCGDIVSELPLAQSTVSEHLRILKAAGLIIGEVDGPRVCYCIDPTSIRRLKKMIQEL
jgi:ArsR family transcriptional regulator